MNKLTLAILISLSTAALGQTISYGPASPLDPVTQTIGNNTANPASLSFQAENAIRCTAAITGGIGATFTSGVVSGAGTASAVVCLGAPCANSQSIQMNFPHNTTPSSVAYAVTATCNSSSDTKSSLATVTVPPYTPTLGCLKIPSATTGIKQFTRLTGVRSVNYFGSGTKNVDITSFNAVYGRTWPGSYGLIAQFTLANSNYIALQFTTPDGFFSTWPNPNPLYGNYSVGQSGYSAPITFTISTQCGDFSNPATNPASTVVTGCYSNKAGSGSAIQWRGNNKCILSDNQMYYLNIINADVTNVTPDGGTAISTKNSRCTTSCNDPIQDGPGTWSGWTGSGW